MAGVKPSRSGKAGRVFKSALMKIKPTKRQQIADFSEAERIMKRLRASVPQSVEVKLVGSLAKGTNLKGNNEYDIFLLFPRHYPHHEMSMLGINYARRAFHGMKTEVKYAQHPYLRVFTKKRKIDIVPAYKIRKISERGSSVDRSQLHTDFINSHLSLNQKDDVRLLKQFTKAFGIYGAEIRVEGFSGYLCELLIEHYGSLLKLMEEASKWEEPAVDSGGKRDSDSLRKLFGSPLIVIDPVDEGRNVAAVVAQTSLSRFIFECRRFLANPSEALFFPKRKKASSSDIAVAMKRRGTLCLAVVFPAPDLVPDILWPQLKKTAQAIARRLEELDFSVFGYYHWSDQKECVVFLEFGSWSLPDIKKALGPGIRHAKDVSAFVSRHKNSFNLHLEHDRIVAVEKMECTSARKALASLCQRRGGIGIPDSMQKAMKKHKILEGKRIIRKEFVSFLSDYFFMKIA